MQIGAPSNFDWQKYAIRQPGTYAVYRTTVASELPAEVYRSPDSRFCLPYIDRRGAYWDVRVVPPTEASRLGSSRRLWSFQPTTTRLGVIPAARGIVLIREPAQIAAGLVWMLHERSAVSSSLFGVECECAT